jgi:hypothetical protein
MEATTNKETDMNRTTRLIGIGNCPASAASTITTGTHLMYNYGYITLVLDVKPRGKTQIEITETTLGYMGKEPSSYTTTRVMNRNTAVVRVLKVESVSGVNWAILNPMGSAA